MHVPQTKCNEPTEEKLAAFGCCEKAGTNHRKKPIFIVEQGIQSQNIQRERKEGPPSIYAIEPCMAPKLNFSSAPLSLCDYLIFTPIHKCLTFYKRDSAHIPNKNNTMQNIGSEFVRSFPLSVTPRSSDFLHVNTLQKI